MALGVLNSLSAIYAENNLNNTSSGLQTVLRQLSSGSRINSGADDAAGLSLVNGLKANSTALMQSGTNATEGVGLLKVADGALSQVTSLLNRAITLATEASHGTFNASQDSAANQECQSILAEINNIGSTTTFNQQQVFGGAPVAIYTGDSSVAGASIDLLNIRSLSSGSVGDTAGAMSYTSGANNVFVDLFQVRPEHRLPGRRWHDQPGGGLPRRRHRNGGQYSHHRHGSQQHRPGTDPAINNANLGVTASFGRPPRPAARRQRRRAWETPAKPASSSPAM